MRYYVLAPSGERFGPADVPTLNQWAADHRLFPHTQLMDEMTNGVLQASSVPGLVFPQAAPPPPSAGPMQPPPPGAPYRPAMPIQPGASHYNPGIAADDGKKDLLMAFGAALLAPAIGLLLMYGIFIAIAGVQLAWKAMQKGQKLAIVALILNIIAIPIAFYLRFFLRGRILFGQPY